MVHSYIFFFLTKEISSPKERNITNRERDIEMKREKGKEMRKIIPGHNIRQAGFLPRPQELLHRRIQELP
jgi:hypothetical protein